VLTRIEIDGFKTFEDFSLALGPLTVIAGTNASGKSNLFDAIQLLARLAQHDLRSAVAEARGEPHELFRRNDDGEFGKQIRLAVEVLLEPRVRDPWGQEQELIQTRLRYELTIERRGDRQGLERLYVVHEEARPIRASDDLWARPYKKPRRAFARRYLKYGRQAKLLETTDDSGNPSFQIHQDDKAGRMRPAVAAEATVLSSITTAEFRHLFALREEMRSWRFLQLDPAALRKPVQQQAPDRLEPSGWNLAAVLARVKAETATGEDPNGLLTELSADLAHLIPGVTGVAVEQDLADRRWELSISTRSQAPYSGRVASDGTLRLLALLTALNDPLYGGLICFEEPENGVHPARLGPLIRHLRGLVDNSYDDLDDDEAPLLQLLLTTHSPVVVRALKPDEQIFFESASTTSSNGGPGGRRTNALPVREDVQTTLDPEDVGRVVTRGEVERYLATVTEA